MIDYIPDEEQDVYVYWTWQTVDPTYVHHGGTHPVAALAEMDYDQWVGRMRQRDPNWKPPREMQVVHHTRETRYRKAGDDVVAFEEE